MKHRIPSLLPAAVLALAALSPLPAKDLATKASAKIDITTNTSYGVSLDDTRKRGLQMDFSHFGLSYDFAPGGLLTNAVKSDDPYGFIQVEFGGLSLAWGNSKSLYDKDLNQPSTVPDTGLGFNGGNTGYSYPIYLERFASGINWGPWFLQLAAGGDEPENWRPWSNFLRGYIRSEMLQRWAFQDTRIQYQRPNIPTMLSKMSNRNIPDEGQYWNNGNPYDSNGAVATKGTLRDIVLNPSGTLVGLNYNADDWSAMLKFVTEKGWSDAVTDNPGQALGLDFAYTPQEIPGLKAYASAGIEQDYGTDGSPQPWALGGKAGYTFPVSDTISLEPYAGVQIKHWDKIGTLGSLDYENAHEASMGLTVHWPGDGGWQWDPLQQRNGVLFPGLTLAYTIRDNNDLYDTSASSKITKGSHPIQSLLLTLYEESGDGGLLEGIGSEIAVQYNDFQNFSKGLGATSSLNQLLVTTYFDYTIPEVFGGQLVPWTKVFVDDIGQQSGGSAYNLKVDAGLRLEKAVRNTTFGFTYESKNLTGTTSSATNLVSGEKGQGLARVWIEVRI